MMKVIGKLWSTISVEERQCYEALSEAGRTVSRLDKARYRKEVAEFEDKGGTNTIMTTNEAKPKKCLSPYMIFVRET